MRFEPLAYLVNPDETNADATNFWIFSEEGLRRILRRSGWKIRGLVTTGDTHLSDPVRGDRDERAFCLLESLVLQPNHAPVLVNGWHELMENWRWTGKKFSVKLGRDPLTVPDRLELRFQFMPQVAAVTGPIKLSATVNGRRLEPQIFRKPGEHVYSAVVPKGAAGWEESLVEFELDKALPPSGQDQRELGLLVSFDEEALLANDINVPIRFV